MPLNWGIIGAGSIARAFAVGAKTCQTGKLLAAASRDKAKADKFAAEFAVPTAYGSYEDLLNDLPSAGGLRLRPAPVARPMGHRGTGSRQACAVREAVRAELLGSHESH